MVAVKEEFRREMESKNKSHTAEVFFLQRKLAEYIGEENWCKYNVIMYS